MPKNCLYNATEEMDLQLVQLEKARAILSKVADAFSQKVEPGTSDAFLLIADMERLHLLLSTADELIYRVIPELKTIGNDVLNIYKRHRRDWEIMQEKARSNLSD